MYDFKVSLDINYSNGEVFEYLRRYLEAKAKL